MKYVRKLSKVKLFSLYYGTAKDEPDEKQEFIEKAKLIASVLDESHSNLIATYLESYVKSHSEELKAIERLQAKARKG